MTLVCCVCGTDDWVAVKPGEAADATPLSPNCMQAVLIFPQQEIPSVLLGA